MKIKDLKTVVNSLDENATFQIYDVEERVLYNPDNFIVKSYGENGISLILTVNDENEY